MAPSGSAHPELPGLTYDERIGRYVKILPNHHARALGGAAGAAAVSAVKDATSHRKRRRDEAENEAIILNSRIRSSRINRNAILGYSLGREIGLRSGCTADVRGQVWSQLLEPCRSVPIPGMGTWYMMKKNVQNNALLAIRHQDGAPPNRSSKLNIVFNSDENNGIEWFPCETSFGRVSSMSITEKYAFMTTFGRSDPNMICEIPTNKPADASSVSERVFNISKSDNHHDYWCTSFHPDTSKPRLAVGTEHSVIIHNPFCSHGHGLKEYRRPSSSAPTLSIQWKSENVIAAGLRDKTVQLYDTRARDVVTRLRHKTAVMRLKCVDDTRILLGGPEHLDMYDLRYNKTPHKYRSSRPWLQYRNYDNKQWKTYDIDISPRLGLLAVALERSTEIWNLWTGAKIREILSSLTPSKCRDRSEVVMFTRENHKEHFFSEESDPVSVLVASESAALEWDVKSDGFYGEESLI